jgi:signal transduction histidine kinase
MSHELRTPLNAIIGYSEVMLEEAEIENNLDDVYIDDIGRIRQAGQHLLRIINDILDLSKIEANQTTLEIVDFSIEAMVSSVTETIRPMSDRQNNRIEIRNTIANDEMISDPQKLQQILLNLMSNAAKFTENGSISLNLYCQSDNLICFEVRDTGIGIPANSIDYIFESFRQVDNSMSRSFDGTGLGLTISKRLSSILGGTLTVKSQFGQGTAFLLTIPRCLGAKNSEIVPVHSNVSLIS